LMVKEMTVPYPLIELDNLVAEMLNYN
jgi:hypothetical protein